MKIKFLGVGSAFTTPEYYQSNMLVTSRSGKQLLVDCGGDIRFSLSESKGGEHIVDTSLQERSPDGEIDAIYISHLHSDHIGGMEWMAFKTYFSLSPEKPKLFMEEKLMHEMWNWSLKGGLGTIEGKCMHLTDYFDCRPMVGNGAFHWENIVFSLIKMPHIINGYRNIYSYGLLIQEVPEGPAVFITTDTQFEPGIVSQMGQKAAVIFHDCETNIFKSLVHAHYDDLRTLPPSLRRKIWLYHYQPHPDMKPGTDGFAGFVSKGQEFDFS
ncbi:MBL fold metallo-hydrolase [Desulfococcaceae bacterium HSG8]|nr:MBL fold metallo-hydrolase [Desulfococcaceae bacterium HSG8]